MTKSQHRRALSLLTRIQNHRTRGKASYQKADELEKLLRNVVPLGEPIERPDGRKFAVVDQLSAAGYLRKLTFINRYELVDLSESPAPRRR